MAARVWLGLRTRTEYLRRLSVVYAVELRLKIVTELFMREMSPKQFYEEFGGGSVARVSQNFERLVETGWLRYVRSEGPGGKRRGRAEHFYRATELAIFDYETWRLLPYSLRVAFSWSVLTQLAERWSDALEAGTFNSRPERHTSCTVLQLDQQGWDRVIAAIDAVFISLFEEQEDARLRCVHTGEEPMLAVVSLMGFESPMRQQRRGGPRLARPLSDSPVPPFSVRLARLFADELYMAVLGAANERSVSVLKLAADLGVNPDSVRTRLNRLVEAGWLRQVDQRTGGRLRGGVERYYRATAPRMHRWDVGQRIRAMEEWAIFEQISDRAKAAMMAGAFDARTDRYSTWSLLRLDNEGWRRITAAIERLLAICLKEEADARDRLTVSKEAPIVMTVPMAAFEAPAGAEKEW